MKGKRGQLTDEIKEKSKILLGYEITQTELRLMPYIQYVMLNEKKINPVKISQEERNILNKWRQLGYIDDGAPSLTITKEFWNIICELIFLGYVDIE